jgi:hypothetical protein
MIAVAITIAAQVVGQASQSILLASGLGKRRCDEWERGHNEQLPYNEILGEQ